jgi:glycosyltransferase involved in cell wall biosynthesis
MSVTERSGPRHTGPQRLTVLHVAQPVDGGVARVVTDLVRAQAAEGLRPVVLCPSGQLAESAAAAGAEVLAWSAGREPSARIHREAAQVARAARELRPDLVHLHSAKAGLAGRLALRGRVPTVFQPHAWSFEAVSGRTAALALRWERHAARWADRVVCVSEDERRRGLLAGIQADWAVIRNGIDIARFAAPAPPPAAPDGTRGAVAPAASTPQGVPAAADRRRSGEDGGPLVVCMGRLCHQKGQDILLRAWPEVAARVPGARLALVGEGPAGAELRAAAPHGVEFPGATEDPASWYAAARLVVAPSRWEGMALAPLEAMACGRPVLVSEVAGARESLPPAHVPLCLVPPGDAATLAHALIRLLQDPARARELGEQARLHARAEHDVRRTAAAFSRLYRSILPGEAAHRPRPLVPKGPLTARESTRP